MKRLILSGFALALLIAFAFAEGESLIFTRNGGSGVGGSAVTGPYIFHTNGFGTNTSFFDGLTVDADGMTNAGPYRGMADQDSTNVFGRGVIHSATTDAAYFSHFDRATSTAYGFAQTAAGATFMNAPTGQSLNYGIQGATQWTIDASGDFIPGTDAADDIGLLTARVRNFLMSGGFTNFGTTWLSNRVATSLQSLSYSGTNVTVDWSLANHFTLTLTNNAKLWFTNAAGAGWSQTGLIDLVQDGTGSRLLYWDSTNIRTNPAQSVVLSTAANSIDDMHVKTDSTGTNFHILLNTGWAK